MEGRVEAMIKSNQIQFVRLEYVDINGVSRGYMCDADFFESHVQYNGFPVPTTCLGCFNTRGDIVEETGLGSDIQYQNGMLYPDLQSFKVLPWLEDTAAVFADFHFPGNESIDGVCCRSACKKQLKKLQNMGLSLYSALEYEFYTVNEQTLLPLYQHTNYGACELHNKIRTVMQSIMRNMKSIGVKPEVFHAEFAPAQQEITMMPEFDIASIDNGFRFKSVVKETCRQHDIDALFLSKPFEETSGSSGHYNHSLWDLTQNKNAFSDDSQPDKLSDICRYWVGGLQFHSKALTALSCHTLNCIERLKPNSFAPTNNSWGFDNRTVSFRLKNQTQCATYIENRIPGSGSNPYFVTLGCLIAGIDGIERKLLPTSQPYQGNMSEAEELPTGVEKLPGSLEEAIQCLEEDKVFVKELGGAFIKAFIALRRDEEKKKQEEVNDGNKWEWYRKFYGMYV